MPRNIYTICSRLISEDRLSGNPSFFHVLEQISATATPPGQPTASFTFMVTTAWMREPNEDPAQHFELQIAVAFPQAGDFRRVLVTLPFQFAEQPIRKFCSEVTLNGLLPEDAITRLEADGIMIIEAKVRAVDSAQWQTATYPILVRWLPNPQNGAPHP